MLGSLRSHIPLKGPSAVTSVTGCHPCPAAQIFTERPEVHRAYLAHVPGTMDEKAFWTRYFKQQYRRMAQRCVLCSSRSHAEGGSRCRWQSLLKVSHIAQQRSHAQ